jgi:DNA (cytosine-5)-methyltransferase 1
MVRASLGPTWRCLFANDFDSKKASVYRKNRGDVELKPADVGSQTTREIRGRANLAWDRFPARTFPFLIGMSVPGPIW